MGLLPDFLKKLNTILAVFKQCAETQHNCDAYFIMRPALTYSGIEMNFIKYVLVISIVSLATPAVAAVQEFHLANGLRILVKEDHRAPIVVSQLWIGRAHV